MLIAHKHHFRLKHFYIFRHGECPFNQSGHIQGQSFNGSLTEKGCHQATLVGLELKKKNIELIISSPLQRALQSARLVRQNIKVPIFPDNRLTEVNMGIVEGMLLSVAEKKYAELYRRWRSNLECDCNVHFENGESKSEVRKRIFEALNFYASQTPYHNIAVSGHGITISQILLYFNIIITDIPNGSILHLAYSNHNWFFLNFMTGNQLFKQD